MIEGRTYRRPGAVFPGMVSRLLKAVVMVLLPLALLEGCVRRELVDVGNTHYVRVYLDEHIMNVTGGFYSESNVHPVYKRPQILRVALADKETGTVRAERYLRNQGDDDKGHYYDGYIIADPGWYDLLVYNFDTEVTLIQNQNNFMTSKAYTNEIASHLRSQLYSRTKVSDDEKIVYDPDHLFVAAIEDVRVPYVNYIDTLHTQEGGYFVAESIVKSYYVQVRVAGMKYVSSAVSLLDGLAGSSNLATGMMNEDDPVTVYFEMTPGGESQATGMRKADAMEARDLENEEDAEDLVVLYTTFSTFGKIPSATNNLEITFDFMTVYGEPYYERIDITDVFSTPEALEHQWLLIDKTIVIPEPPPSAGGGFNPGVDEWGDVNTDITI